VVETRLTDWLGAGDVAQAARLDAASAAQLVDAMAVSIELVDPRWQEAFDAPALPKPQSCKLATKNALGRQSCRT